MELRLTAGGITCDALLLLVCGIMCTLVACGEMQFCATVLFVTLVPARISDGAMPVCTVVVTMPFCAVNVEMLLFATYELKCQFVN